jgi:NAD(P)-dependent dehydrogenase (short-subunit alcohol dehydrogenase family)
MTVTFLSRILLALIASTLLMQQSHADAHEHADAAKASTVLITGANRGIGLEFARQYADAGWTVIGTARDPDEADELRATGATVVQLDVIDAASVAALTTTLKNTPIDLLINNAGIFPRYSSLEEVNFDDVARTLDVNVIGPMRVTQALLEQIGSSQKKTIVNISSRLGSIEMNTSGNFYGYRESKTGLNMFSRTLAVELKEKGFIVAAVHPGWVQTDMGGANANLTPEESVTAMRATIEKLTPDLTGTYWSYDGNPVPW